MKQNDENNIHPTVIIGNDVKIGKGNKIFPYSIIEGPVVIGNNNVIGPHAVIGSPPTDSKKIIPRGKEIRIGDRNIIREFCVIEQPCYEEYTIIENDVFIMESVCIGHDVHMKSKSTAVNNVVTGGISKILEGAYLAMGSLINQITVIGQYSIVAAGFFCKKNVKPFSMIIPEKPIKVNKYAIYKYGFIDYEDEITRYVLENEPVKNRILFNMIDEYENLVQGYSQKKFS